MPLANLVRGPLLNRTTLNGLKYARQRGRNVVRRIESIDIIDYYFSLYIARVSRFSTRSIA